MHLFALCSTPTKHPYKLIPTHCPILRIHWAIHITTNRTQERPSSRLEGNATMSSRATVFVLLCCMALAAHAGPQCGTEASNVSPAPKFYHKPLDRPLAWLRYDGLSPYSQPVKVVKGRNDMNIYLRGRYTSQQQHSPLAGVSASVGVLQTETPSNRTAVASKLAAWLQTQ